MSFLSPILQFFGLGKQEVVTPIALGIKESSEKEFASFTDSAKKLEYLTDKVSGLDQNIAKQMSHLTAEASGHAIDKEKILGEIKQTLDLASAIVFWGQELNKLQESSPQNVDNEVSQKGFELALGVLKLLAVPAIGLMDKLESYINQYEEQLLFEDARGEYRFGISENRHWIKLPLTEFLSTPKALDPAKKALAPYFFEFSSLAVFEFTTRVPFLPTSFVDITRLTANKQVTPVHVPELNAWLLYIL